MLVLIRCTAEPACFYFSFSVSVCSLLLLPFVNKVHGSYVYGRQDEYFVMFSAVMLISYSQVNNAKTCVFFDAVKAPK